MQKRDAKDQGRNQEALGAARTGQVAAAVVSKRLGFVAAKTCFK